MRRRTRRDFTMTEEKPQSNDTQTASDSQADAAAAETPRRRKRRELPPPVAPETEVPATPAVQAQRRRERTLGRLRSLLRMPSQGGAEAPAAAPAETPSAAATDKELPRKAVYDLLDPRRYVGADDHMRIDKDDWKALQQKFAGANNRGKLVQLLDDIVTVNKLEPPMRMITRDEAKEAFKELKQLDTRALMDGHRTQSRFNYNSTLGLLTVEARNAGNLTSDYLFQSIRWTCRGGRVQSPEESWADAKDRRAVFHNMIDDNVDYVDRHRLRKYLGTRRYIPTPYRPATAKALFDYLRPESVLDLSFGWGDRLVGFEASEYPVRYHGIDPDARVLEAGRKLHKLCRQTRKEVELYLSPAEDFAYGIVDPVDMLYFAPPPFNTERYTDEDTQAYVRYRDEQSFVQAFLLKTIVKAWDALKPGGTLALDLGDLRAPKRDLRGRDTGGRYQLVDPLIRQLKHELPDMIYRGTVGTCVGHRKPSSDLEAVRVDPIWIMTKGHSALARQALFGRKRAAELDAAQGLR